MKIVSLLFLMGLCVALYTIPYGQSAISVIEENTTEIGTVPCVDWIFHIDAGDGYVAVITDEGKTFRLLGSTAESGFSVSLEDNGGFFVVSMKSRSGLVMVGKAFSEGNYQYIGYDYNGRAVLGPLDTENTVEIDPTGRFFYSYYDIGNDQNKPAIYDGVGNTMAEFKSSGLWDIKVIDSLHILFCNHNRIQILRYPDLTVEKEIVVPHDHILDILSSALSPDGTFYAYVVHDKIFIIDLNTGQIFHVPNRMKNNIPSNPQLVLSKKGAFLILSQLIDRKKAITIFQRQDTDFKQIVDKFEMPVSPGHAPYHEISAGDSYCAFSYFLGLNDCIDFVSYIFELPQTETDTLAGEVLNGLISEDSFAEFYPPSLRFTTISSGIASTRLIKIKGDAGMKNRTR